MSLPDNQIAMDKQLTKHQQTPRVEMEDAPRLLRTLKSECPDVSIRLPRHDWPKLWSTIVPPARHLNGGNVCSSKTMDISVSNMDDIRITGRSIIWLTCGRT